MLFRSSLGQPYRWNRATGESLALPWSGGTVTDMALSQTGSVVTYTERSGGTSGTMRTWTEDRVRAFGATVAATPGPQDRDVFINSSGSTVLFRVGTGVRSVNVSTGVASFVPLTSVVGIDRAGGSQVTAGDGNPVRFEVGAVNSTARTGVQYPPATNPTESGVVFAGDGASVIFTSQSEMYRWRTNGQLTFLQSAGTAVLGTPRDASITGRFVLTTRAGATRGILEILDTAGTSVPIVAVDQLAGPQLSDQIRRLYLAYFDREPDPGGRDGWLIARANGAPLDAVSSAFAASTEFQQTYGSLDDGQFVDLVYQNLFGRAPDAEGRTFWLGLLAAGVSRGSVMTSLSEAEEYRNLTGTSTPIDTPVAHQIERLYRAYFDRSADQGGLDFWLEQFAGGAGLGSLSQEFARSTEFTNTYGDLNNAQFVDLVYNNVLGRPGEAEGVAFWLGALNDGTLTRGQVMIGFSESAEYIIATDTLPPAG